MADSSFGARLRQRREGEQITLASISEQTKINLSLLEALERDDVSHWPGGIFRRAFIRAYAHAINLEPDVVVREFLERYPDPVEDVAAEPVPAPGVTRAGVSDGPPIRLRYLVGSAADSVSRWLGSAGTRPAVVQPAVVGRAVVEVEQAVVERATPADAGPVAITLEYEPDLLAVAHLCTELGRVYETREAGPLLQRAASLLDAVGVIVWAWDAQSAELRPALAHGYSDKVLAQLPKVRREADNATAAAFRSTQTCIVNGSDMASGAVTVPLMTSGGCVGVFAAELRHGGEQREPLRALATIFAAQLATLIGTTRLPQAVNA
jgi:transcriptional regulator with XRE-family HTH domain